jgi:hypothetical protein
MTPSGRQDDAVKHCEPWDGRYVANEYSEAVSPRTLLEGLRRNTARMCRLPGLYGLGDHDRTPDADDAALVGIDWAETTHDFCLRVRGADQEEYGVMGPLPEAIDPWARELAGRFPGRQIAVCLAQAKGSLIYALLKYDSGVRYPSHPRRWAKVREALAPSGPQDAPADAQL